MTALGLLATIGLFFALWLLVTPHRQTSGMGKLIRALPAVGGSFVGVGLVKDIEALFWLGIFALIVSLALINIGARRRRRLPRRR